MEPNSFRVDMTDAEFTKLRAIIHDNTGITIGETRKSMLISRLRSRLRAVEEPDFKAYIARLPGDRNEMQQLINRVTTNETYFYRTPRVWEYFRDTRIAEFLDKGERRPFRVWSAAASTGEEGHTAGIVLEDVRQKHTGFDYSVLGTDISSRVIDAAKEGLYSGKAISRFSKERPDLFNKYMHSRDEVEYSVRPEIKTRIKFQLHNLVQPLKSPGGFDVVFLRNVLIYFTLEDQAKILRHVFDNIRPDGVLFIGESESLSQVASQFEPIVPFIYRPCSHAS